MKVEIRSIIKLFDDHIKRPENKQILFSGQFGFGKTYFLEQYFDKTESYNDFWISPIKYIVGQNEDVFEYIKLDISLKLIEIPELRPKSFPNFKEDLYIHQYLSTNAGEVATILGEMLKDLDIPIIKKGISAMLAAQKIRTKYLDWKSKINESGKSELQQLINFGISHTTIKGSIFEDDSITQLIRLSLSGLKDTNKKENILIIDDFDRLDPEHIFRILNILSIHQNQIGSENKFGFDKILIVCSIENIRKIFEHKYGIGVNFDGYMSKFYSTEIFHFNNQNEISRYCKAYFNAELEEDSLNTLSLILATFIENNTISIRSLDKFKGTSIIRPFTLAIVKVPELLSSVSDKLITEFEVYIDSELSLYWDKDFHKPFTDGLQHVIFKSEDFPILKMIQILSTISGDFNILKQLIDSSVSSKQKYDINLKPSVVKTIMPLYLLKNINNNDEAIFHREYSKELVLANRRVHLNTVIPPTSEIFGDITTLNLGWNQENQYNGKVGYYSQIRPNPSETGDTAISQIFVTLSIIINYLENSGFIYNLGLTK